jgi:DNA-binding response OmpR family regulator
MEGVILPEQQSVLIVDRSEETREVLRTALERRGMRTFSAARAPAGLELARTCHPDLIVLDLELDNSDGEDFSSRFAEQSRGSQTPLVMLGTLQREHPVPAGGEFVAKPYHYRPLVRKIEELLQQCAVRRA